MPFALVLIGILLVVVGFQDTYKQLGTQVQKDFTGPGNFVYWIISIGVIGALGYVKELQTFSRITLGLIILVLFLSNKGFFNQFNSAIQSGSTAPVNPVGTALPAAPAGSSSGSTSDTGGGIIGEAAGSLFTAALL